ncbi:hypothetical protein TanjilG_18322 [Lupinus angustifolius]|uniref:LOB domain-containing protein n=1 Tax=Lupinus angustifolius TaxID=3871 RepID=A0A1J7H2H1_LUPAN|nr:PREDICTED: LOB domain-containing protein 40-like [Lupinus angustifolius]OIW06934.1 hypothetical protein TanjilG_18322 [Lupinus angustifolius]
MKVSCNGCRTLRKACNDDCVFRPCLEWINSPESQANATMFLAKFYGRTAFTNLISAAPEALRPDVFKSLLREACGRLLNPTYGLIGLVWTGSLDQCEAAVEAVLNGSWINGVTAFDWPATGITNYGGAENVIAPGDIQHVPRVRNMGERTRFNRAMRTMNNPTTQVNMVDSPQNESMETVEQPLNQFAVENELNLELTLTFHG